MLKFKVQIKQSLIEFEVPKTDTVADLKGLIAKQQNISNFDLFIFSNKLADGVSVGKILYNCVTDSLEVRFREKVYVPKLKSFFGNAIPLLRQKTLESTAKLKKKLLQEKDDIPQNQVTKILSFFTKAPQLVKQKTSNQFSTFLDQFKGQVTMSHINQMEEDQPRNLNNDTVFNILDDMKKQDEVKKLSKEKPPTKNKKSSLSPKQEQYLQRKKKAIELLEDPKQKEKAKLLIQEMKKQKQLLKERIQEYHNQSTEIREQSIEHYKAERDQMMQRIAQEKKNKIQQKLQENQQYHQIQLQMHKQSQHLISELKTRMKKVQDMAKQKDDQLKQIYYEEAKVKLQERKKQAKPIRLQELNAHEDQYMENKEIHRIQRDQKKLEQEIKLRAKTKSVYRDEKILQEVIKIDQQIKNKDIQEQKKRELYRIRKQKYSEIIYEFHKPTQMSRIEEAKVSIDDAKLKRDSSLRYSMHDEPQKSSFVELLAKKGLREKNIKKIQSALSQQHIPPKTQITETLQQGKVPDASTYFHMRVHTPARMSVPEESSSKKRDYLREFERERKSSTHQAQIPNKSPQQQLRYMQKLEQDAKKKEQLALICGDDDLQVEATDLYLQSTINYRIFEYKLYYNIFQKWVVLHLDPNSRKHTPQIQMIQSNNKFVIRYIKINQLLQTAMNKGMIFPCMTKTSKKKLRFQNYGNQYLILWSKDARCNNWMRKYENQQLEIIRFICIILLYIIISMKKNITCQVFVTL